MSTYMTLEEYTAMLKVGDKDTLRFRKNGHCIDSFGYQGGLISGYSLKNPYKKPFDFTRVKV